MKLHAHRDVRSHFAEVLIADREEAMALFPLIPLHGASMVFIQLLVPVIL